MTKFERIMETMTVAEYAILRSDANKCPSTRTLGQCSEYTKNHKSSTRCFFCWVDWLLEDDE